MKGRVIHSTEGTISFCFTPAYCFILPALLVRLCRILFMDILFTLVAVLLVGSLTLVVCGQLDKVKMSLNKDADVESFVVKVQNVGVEAEVHVAARP